MLKKDIVLGGVYRVRWHDGSFTEVELIRELHRSSFGHRYAPPKRMCHYQARNLATGRIVEIKSAAKLRERVR